MWSLCCESADGGAASHLQRSCNSSSTKQSGVAIEHFKVRMGLLLFSVCKPQGPRIFHE